MRIAIIGAAGKAGRALFQEAFRRGHHPVGLVRDLDRARGVLGDDADLVAADAFELSRVQLLGYDVVIDAFSAAPAQAYLHVDLATRLVALLRGTETPRLVFILGAGSLTTGDDGHLLVDELRAAPGAETWIATPENQLKELRFLEGVDNVNWVGVSPSGMFVPGPAAPPVLGRDQLLADAEGRSQVTTGTMAVAILDEIELPVHLRTRFTVRDGE